MTRPLALPPALRNRPFSVAEARDRGVPHGTVRSPGLLRPTRGARLAPETATEQDGPALRARAFVEVLPGDLALSHLTAARLLGLPVPRPWRAEEPLDVMRPSGAPPVIRRGCRSHRGLERRAVRRSSGLLVTAGPDTFADLAASLHLDDLVAVGDALLGEGADGTTDVDALRTVLAERDGWRGVRRAREALDLVRSGSRSAWESKARVAFHLAGLPEPELNAPVHDSYGQWLATPDFVWREQRVVGEYDGDQHRTDRSAWQYERERRARLEDEGWTYVEMTATSLTDPRHRHHLMARLHRALTW